MRIALVLTITLLTYSCNVGKRGVSFINEKDIQVYFNSINLDYANFNQYFLSHEESNIISLRKFVKAQYDKRLDHLNNKLVSTYENEGIKFSVFGQGKDVLFLFPAPHLSSLGYYSRFIENFISSYKNKKIVFVDISSFVLKDSYNVEVLTNMVSSMIEKEQFKTVRFLGICFASLFVNKLFNDKKFSNVKKFFYSPMIKEIVKSKFYKPGDYWNKSKEFPLKSVFLHYFKETEYKMTPYVVLIENELLNLNKKSYLKALEEFKAGIHFNTDIKIILSEFDKYNPHENSKVVGAQYFTLLGSDHVKPFNSRNKDITMKFFEYIMK